MDASALLVHSGTNLSHVWQWMHFKSHRPAELPTFLPTRDTVQALLRPLRSSSCAVVGASAALVNCTHRHDICSHDVVIHANDHAELLRYCPRVDIQIVNAWACFWRTHSNPTAKTFVRGTHSTNRGAKTQRCAVKPTRARIRHEWNPSALERFGTGTLLASGLASTMAHEAVGRCCASAGGVALAFALQTCKLVTTYGLGGINYTHIDSSERSVGTVHNMLGEVKWLSRLERERAITRRC